MGPRFRPTVRRNDLFDGLPVSGKRLIEQEQVLVRMTDVSLCQTDRRAALGTKSSSMDGKIEGHEGGGHVVDPGPLEESVEPGALVVVLPHLTCGQCDRCGNGRPNLCRSLRHVGLHLGGTLADLALLPARCVYPVDMSFPQTALPLVEPLACVLRAFSLVWDVMSRLSHGGDKPRLGVAGAGPMGTLIALYGKRLCPFLRVTMADPNDERRRLAERLGVVDEVVAEMPAGLESPLIFAAASASMASDGAMRSTRPGGTVVLFAGIDLSDLDDADPAQRARATLWEEIHRGEKTETFPGPAGPVRLVGSSGYTLQTIRRSIDELRRHYHHYAVVQNVVVNSLYAREAYYRWPEPRTVTFPVCAVEALLSPLGVNDPRYGREIAGCLKPLIKL